MCRVEVDVFKLCGCAGDESTEIVVSLVGVPYLVGCDLYFFVIGDDDAGDDEVEEYEGGECFESFLIFFLFLVSVEQDAVEYVFDALVHFGLSLLSVFGAYVFLCLALSLYH